MAITRALMKGGDISHVYQQKSSSLFHFTTQISFPSTFSTALIKKTGPFAHNTSIKTVSTLLFGHSFARVRWFELEGNIRKCHHQNQGKKRLDEYNTLDNVFRRSFLHILVNGAWLRSGDTSALALRKDDIFGHFFN